MRLLGPVLVLLTILLFASGIELWLFGLTFGRLWLTLHQASFVLWFLAIGFHVFGYLRRTSELAAADFSDTLRGALTRRSLLIAAVLLGAVLAAAMLPFHSPFPAVPAGG